MTGPLKCRCCGHVFTEEDVGYSCGKIRFRKNSNYPEFVSPGGNKFKSTYPVILRSSSGRYFCRGCTRSGKFLEVVDGLN